jgi:two-component system CheB/CheR fusion protein
MKRRVFRAAPRAHRDRLLVASQTGREMTTSSTQSRLREMAFESDLLPQIVVDLAGTLVAANTPARDRFGIDSGDLGRPVQDLEVSYRPAELRGALNRAITERQAVQIKDVEWTSGSALRYFDIDVTPLIAADGALLGTRASFQDVTQIKALHAELQRSKLELETAYEELQSTNEELETTNEELQSTIEELETTNEELQSTNEELETMNEELQSTNEELQTMNDEMRNRSTDLNSANSFLESVFTSLHSAVVVVDRELTIQVWNTRAADLWGARPEEVQGTHLLSLDIGLPVADLRPPIREVLFGAKEYQEAVLPATNRRGRPIQCRIGITPLRQPDQTIAGAILLMDERSA